MWMKAFTYMTCQSIRMFGEKKSLPARQCQQTCNIARIMFTGCHAIPLDQSPRSQSISDRPPVGYMIISLPSCHISWIGTLASLILGNAFHKGWGVYNLRLLLSMRKKIHRIHTKRWRSYMI